MNELALTAPRIFINLGGRALVPDIHGIDSVPHHLVVVGGSYIGLEFAQMYRLHGLE